MSLTGENAFTLSKDVQITQHSILPFINFETYSYVFTEDGPSLPTRQSEEFRPFIRRLPEFKFW